MRIASKLALAMMGVSLPGVLITAWVGYQNQVDTIRQQTLNQLTAINAAKQEHVESYFRNLRSVTGLVSTDKDLQIEFENLRQTVSQLKPPSDRKALSTAIQRYVNFPDGGNLAVSNSPIGARIQEITMQNRGLLKPSDEPDIKRYQEVMKRLRPIFQKYATAFDFYDVMVHDLESGLCIGGLAQEPDTGASMLTGYLSETRHAKGVREAFSGRVWLADFERYPASKMRPTAFLCLPLKNKGLIVGALTFQLSITQLSKVASGDSTWERIGLGLTGETLLVGNDRTLRNDSRFLSVARSTLSEDLKNSGVAQSAISDIERYQTTVLSVPVKVLAEADGSSAMTGYRGKKVLAAIETLNIKNLNWQILTQKEESEAFQPLTVIARTNLLLTILISLISIGLALFLSRNFAEPLNRMIAATMRVQKGETGVRLNMNRSDEIGALANQFDKMISQDERMNDVADGIRRNIVHDLKTPVTVIRGMAETLALPGVGENLLLREEMLGAITEQSTRLLDDLQDIISPIDSKYIPDPERFDLSILVEKVVKAEKHTGRYAHHEIVVSGTEQPFFVCADRRKLRRAIENLLSNAIKYSPGIDKTVGVKIEKLSEIGFEIEVTDEGLGLTPQELEKVLTVGGLVESNRHEGIEGSGLGLGSVRTILEAHGGTLTAKSVKGIGSTFSAVMPSGEGA